tara:strand:- start:8 stop:517 length:510 start_codon:yes stop_codon:yes gene_type:complete
MKKLLLILLCFAFIFNSCKKDDDEINSNAFRAINNNTFWVSADGQKLTFSPNYIFKAFDNSYCVINYEGTFNNIYYDGTTYNFVTYTILKDEGDTLVAQEFISDGIRDNGDIEDGGYLATMTFILTSNSTLQVNLQYDNSNVEITNLVKVGNASTNAQCLESTSTGFLW